jgi:hypothetical protein
LIKFLIQNPASETESTLEIESLSTSSIFKNQPIIYLISLLVVSDGIFLGWYLLKKRRQKPILEKEKVSNIDNALESIDIEK